jgi:hypothetical protein
VTLSVGRSAELVIGIREAPEVLSTLVRFGNDFRRNIKFHGKSHLSLPCLSSGTLILSDALPGKGIYSLHPRNEAINVQRFIETVSWIEPQIPVVPTGAFMLDEWQVLADHCHFGPGAR